ncbi:DUF4180 domain-containing protein [Paenibacillus elgii]|uniref:DUF4180 domain-containing protein n=1 Tax=Paenibacillus elgii TaxID=189691 RepID=UPI000248D896|nr:DUF4180 domain-containing protein [Paenibacillus elgii]
MEYTKIEKNGKHYIKVVSGLIKEENDGLSLVAACAEHDTNKVMPPSNCLSEQFLRLSTRVAGQVMQKLVNYNIKAVAVIDTKKYRGKFSDFIAEANRGKCFHAFEDLEQAESWLIEEGK